MCNNNITAQKKRKCSYNSAWGDIFDWLRPSTSSDYAECRICVSKFSIGSGGQSDFRRHAQSTKHKKWLSDSMGPSVSQFFALPKEKVDNARAEAVFAYHTVLHSHSYRSAGCCSALFTTLFPDSQMAKKFTCGKTKCCKIVCNVLAPALKKKLVTDLSIKPFSIATDASNKGNIKTFPLVVRFFDKKRRHMHQTTLFLQSGGRNFSGSRQLHKKRIDAGRLKFGASNRIFCR